MDPVNYWLMAREYLVWNAAEAALQFWTADDETHILSSVIEQVYNTFFYSTSTNMLCQQSDEVLFGHFVTTPNAAFESKLTHEDEGYDSGSKILTYRHHLEEPQRFTTSPVKNMHPLIQTQSHHAAEVLENHPAEQYIYALLSVLLQIMMMTPQWMRLHLHTVHYQCSITQIPSINHPPNMLCICMLP